MANITNFPRKLVLELLIGICNGVVEDMKTKVLLKMDICAPRLHPRSFPQKHINLCSSLENRRSVRLSVPSLRLEEVVLGIAPAGYT